MFNSVYFPKAFLYWLKYSLKCLFLKWTSSHVSPMTSPIIELESNSTAPKWVSEHLVSLSPRGGRNCRQSSSYQHQAQRGEELAQPVSERGGPPEAALGGWASPSEALSSGHVTGSCSGHNQPLQMNAIKVSRPAVRGPREGPGAGRGRPRPPRPGGRWHSPLWSA